MAISLRILSVVGGVWLCAGCRIIPEPKPDPTRFYLLTTRVAGTVAPAGAGAVQLRPVDVASYLRNRPMVVRRGDTEIEFREYARWGEPLEQGIGRVLREELLARGVAVAGGFGRTLALPERELSVRVVACEGTTAGAIDFRAVWQVSRTGEQPATIAGGEFKAEGLSWDGKTEAALAARLSEAVAGLAAEIAGALAKR